MKRYSPICINFILNVILDKKITQCNTFFHLEWKVCSILIKCHLSRLMGERKLKVSDVARGIGVHRNAITLLYDETATRVDLETISKLCEFLDCKIEDLFEYCSD